MKRTKMKKRHYIGMLCCLLIMACAKPSPKYDKEVLEGDWLRTSSSDARSDSMIVHVGIGNAAAVLFAPPNSNFSLQQLKWQKIRAVAESGDFQLLDLSADGNLWKAFILMKSETELEIINADYPNAPGGVQKWIKI
ncbi:MAG: Unknown protein [uncultured Aureispira sp.]|uniref:Lipocalin-like domain-containing protein n=1 Tax=uncultured Aureispira sp. TaxID=1331704 RepID=A0A6S6UHG3_9BACT|nr:MAG: Unknown protein [uncultured Aureispira sp.]